MLLFYVLSTYNQGIPYETKENVSHKLAFSSKLKRKNKTNFNVYNWQELQEFLVIALLRCLIIQTGPLILLQRFESIKYFKK